MTKRYKDRDVLEELYNEENMTQVEMAEELNIAQVTVSKWMNIHGIETDPYNKDADYKNPQILRKLHHEEKMTLTEIAEKFNTSLPTVSRWMNRHDIETLRREYVTYKMDKGGYMIWHHHDARVGVHQLLAVSNGEDPYKVFSRGDYHTHHVDGISWHNTEGNLQLMEASEHISHHMGSKNE